MSGSLGLLKPLLRGRSRSLRSVPEDRPSSFRSGGSGEGDGVPRLLHSRVGSDGVDRLGGGVDGLVGEVLGLVEEGYRRGRCDAGRQFKIRVGGRDVRRRSWLLHMFAMLDVSVNSMSELRSSVFVSNNRRVVKISQARKLEVDTFTHAVDLHRLPLPGSLEL